MARVTIEDCVNKVKDRFELVALSSQRTREINSGGELTIERDGEKNTVISLREIAAETVSTEALKESLVNSYQKERETDDFTEEEPKEESFTETLSAPDPETLKELEAASEDGGDSAPSDKKVAAAPATPAVDDGFGDAKFEDEDVSAED